MELFTPERLREMIIEEDRASLDKQRKMVNDFIKQAIRNGNSSITISTAAHGPIHSVIEDELKELGYKVKHGFGLVIVSWRL